MPASIAGVGRDKMVRYGEKCLIIIRKGILGRPESN